MNISLSSICRICLEETENLFTIFDPFYDVCRIVYDLTAIKIEKNDGLPDQICVSCSKEIISISQFVDKCKKGNVMLKNYIDKINSNNVIERSGRDSNKEFNESNELKIEERTADDGTVFEISNYFYCEKCEEMFDDLKLFENHSLVHLNDVEKNQTESDTFCDAIEQIFESGDRDANVHEVLTTRKKKTKKLHNCSMCDATFHKKLQLKIHLLSDHADCSSLEKNYNCIQCNESYSNLELLSTHMRTHEEKLYNCFKCSKIFKNLCLYYEHSRRHLEERSFLCNKCGKSFLKQIYLDKHLKVHANDHVVYECNICGKKVKHVNHLNVHMKTHNKRVDSILAQNEPTKPSVTTPNLCSICGRSCTSKSNLTVHMRRHTGQMTSFCVVCGKGFPRSTDLTVHMRQHTGEKPFGCEICKKSFARSDKLAIHMRTHTGEKPYSCSLCHKSYAQGNDLAAHKKKNVCGQSIYVFKTDETESVIDNIAE